MQSHHSTNFDRAGIVCSALCALHCFLTPLIAIFFPGLAMFVGGEAVHLVLLFIVFPLALYSFYRSAKIHQNYRPMIIGSLGLIVLSLPIIREAIFHKHSEAIEMSLTLAGSLIVIIGHLLNMHKLRSFQKAAV